MNVDQLMFIFLQASRAYKAGKYELALAASRAARTNNIFGLVLGILRVVAVCILAGVLATI